MKIIDELKNTINMMNSRMTEATINTQLELVKSLIRSSQMSQEIKSDTIGQLDVSIAVSDYNVRRKIMYDLINIYKDR